MTAQSGGCCRMELVPSFNRVLADQLDLDVELRQTVRALPAGGQHPPALVCRPVVAPPLLVENHPSTNHLFMYLQNIQKYRQ